MENTQPKAGPTIPPPPSSDQPRSTTSKILAACGVFLGSVYLLNPTAGILELIPDNFPIIGNLDEAAATALVIYGLQHLGRRFKP